MICLSDSAQKFKAGDRVVACETFYCDEVQGIRVGACGTVRESRYNGEIFWVDFDGITPSNGENEHDGAWEMFAHQLELAHDTERHRHYLNEAERLEAQTR